MSESGGAKVAAKVTAPPVAQRTAMRSPAGPVVTPTGFQQAAGNLAVQSLYRGGKIRAKSAVSRPDDPDEREADSLAERFAARSHSQRASTAAGIDSAGADTQSIVDSTGHALSPSIREPYERFFGADLKSARIHTDRAAQEANSAIQAHAFTHGSNVYFGANRFDPYSSQGRRLLAHEFAHVVQQRRSGPALHRQDNPSAAKPDPNAGTVSKTPDATNPDGVDITVEVSGAELGPGRDKDENKQKLVIHTPVTPPALNLRFYAVPVDKLRKAAADPAKQTTPAQPATQTSPDTKAPETKIASDSAHPAGSTVTTLDGHKLTVLASTPEHIITGEYVKYAVGAASTSALKLADGTVIIIDAGINAKNMGVTEQALKDLTMNKLEEFVGDRVVREFLISHAHADHTSLAPEVMRKFPVDIVRINSVQARWPKYKELRKAMVDAQDERIKKIREKFAEDLAKKRAEWESNQPSIPDEGARQARWDRHVQDEFLKQADTIPGAKGARERILIQAKRNVLDVADVDIATGEKLGRSSLDVDTKGTAFGETDPFNIRETQGPIDSARVRDQRKNTKAGDIDPNASAYVITLKTGVRLLVLPDLRANDMKRLMDRFSKATEGLGIDPHFQIWDASHHMQKGWYQGAVPAAQLSKIVDFLFAYRAKKGTDVMIVSAEADLSNPKAKTLVDPANLWLLRAMGFEAYLATSGQDVHVYDITTSQGRQLTGVAAPKAPGKGPPSVTIARAKLALEKLRADRQAEAAALTDETDAAKQTEIRNKLSELDKLIAEIDKAYHDCLAEIPKKFQQPAKGNTTQTLTDAGQGDFPKMKALDELLEKHHFDVPVTTDAHLSPVALVVLGQKPPGGPEPVPDGSPQARARQLAKVRSEIAEINLRVQKGEVTPELQAELLVKLHEYRTVVDNELHPSDPAQKPLEGVTKQLLTDDLKSIDAKIESLQESKSATTFKRVAGELVEQHTVVMKSLPKEPSKVGKATAAGLEVAGRGMGLVMVVTTVTGQGDLMRRWQQGSANKKEVAVGTVHNLVAGAVALKMLRGVPVSNGVFVVLAVLEVGEALVRDYETDEQRNVATAYAAVSATLNLALMAIGGAMMTQVEAPPVAVAGFLLTMAGPTILEALGVHDWLERRLEFDPASVIEVNQKLRKLIPKYRGVVGSIGLEKRARDAADRSVVGDRDALIKQADASIAKYRLDAMDLEGEIMDAFEDAYKEARTSYAGLRELDEYRAQFLEMRFNAGMEGYSGIETHFYGDKKRTALTRQQVDDRFKKMEQGLSLDTMTPDQIRQMPQWTELRDGIYKLSELIKGDSSDEDYHEDIRKQDAKVTAMIDNARYRLDPKSQSDQRTAALLKPGSAAYAAYQEELSGDEVWLHMVRDDYIKKTRTLCVPPVKQSFNNALVSKDKQVSQAAWQVDVVLPMAENSANLFKAMVENDHAPPKSIVDNMFSSAEETQKYREYVKTNKVYARELQRLETTEGIVLGQIEQAKRILAPVAGKDEAKEMIARVDKAAATMKEADGIRYAKRGLVYLDELEGLAIQVKSEEVKTMAAALGGGSKPLSPDELAALQGDKRYGIQGEKIIPPLETRLWSVPGLTRVKSDGTLQSVFRLVGKGDFMVGITHVRPFNVPASKNALVGMTSYREFTPTVAPTSDDYTVRINVIPLNAAAMEAWVTYAANYNVAQSNLAPVKADEIFKKDAPLQPDAGTQK